MAIWSDIIALYILIILYVFKKIDISELCAELQRILVSGCMSSVICGLLDYMCL